MSSRGIRFARALLAVARHTSEDAHRPRLRGLQNCSPSPALNERVKSSHRLGLPYRVSPLHHRGCRSPAEARSRIHPFQGFFPYSVFPASRSHIPPTDPTPPVTLRPQGLSPSRRLAPRLACRAYFISVPLLGFPLQGFDPTTVPYALSNAGSLRVLASPHGSARSSRVSRTLHQAHRQTRGLDGIPPVVPSWGSALPRFLASCRGQSKRTEPDPLALSRVDRTLA
jgi:hypothetical protein